MAQSTPSAQSHRKTLDAHSAVAIGSGYSYVKISLSGAVAASSNNVINYGIEALTVVIDSTEIPQMVALSAEGCYYINATITNNTTGEYIIIKGSMLLDETLLVDCDTKDLYLEDDNTYPATRSCSSIRKDWLNILPGTNELQFDDTGTGSVTVVVSWEDRNN
jgi:hypothetical protein